MSTGTIPFFLRLGNCYELAARCVLNYPSFHGRECILVHGRIKNPKPSQSTFAEIDHAWVQAGNIIYDPVPDLVMPDFIYQAHYQAQVFQKYNALEIVWLLQFTEHYGPWHEPILVSASNESNQIIMTAVERQQRFVDNWNTKYPPGTPVTRYKLIRPLREPEETKTHSKAWVLEGHTAVVCVESVPGCVALESIVPLTVK